MCAAGFGQRLAFEGWHRFSRFLTRLGPCGFAERLEFSRVEQLGWLGGHGRQRHAWITSLEGTTTEHRACCQRGGADGNGEKRTGGGARATATKKPPKPVGGGAAWRNATTSCTIRTFCPGDVPGRTRKRYQADLAAGTVVGNRNGIRISYSSVPTVSEAFVICNRPDVTAGFALRGCETVDQGRTKRAPA
ncbi:hypothetical protein RSPO_c02041 [Ralstonia solanacearum Po82]|uniref:Uncharacterized protein n=1 Tax=Ralstonia solanacearum (strain Po82) TaxID=1031711 RepID=F6G2X2_RALS8|nr:hypothetical protein RSPO_c02041 [Ralstonia solanacearum Po82]